MNKIIGYGLLAIGGYKILRFLHKEVLGGKMTGAILGRAQMGAGRGRSQISRPGEWYVAARDTRWMDWFDPEIRPKTDWAPPITANPGAWRNIVTSNVQSGYFRAKGKYERGGGMI